jgi:hypothetical protein
MVRLFFFLMLPFFLRISVVLNVANAFEMTSSSPSKMESSCSGEKKTQWQNQLDTLSINLLLHSLLERELKATLIPHFRERSPLPEVTLLYPCHAL